MTTSLPLWRKKAIPHEDIRDDHVSEALFAVNLSRAIAREGAAEYKDPVLFFERTHLTRALQGLIRDVLRTLSGEPGASSVIHLQTNFGGGKTHAELALYHLLHEPKKALAVPHIAAFLAANGFPTIPHAVVAALPCADLYAGGREAEPGLTLRTLWGEIAYRLGGADLYQVVRDADEQRAAPGVDLLRQVLTQAGPHLILVDELLHYVDKAAAVEVGASNLATQTVGFLRELTEAVDAVEHSVLVASLTASRMEEITILTAEDAEFTLSKLEDTLRRIEDSRTPIESSEIYDIVRVRLFESVDEKAAAQVAAAYGQFYHSDPWKDILPPESREAGYEELLRRTYPFHPSIVKVLYERWGSRPQFQLTRGTLRFLAHLLAHLWQAPAEEKAVGPLIHLGDVDLSDEDVRAETIRVAGSAWEAVLGTDVAAAPKGGLAIAQRADREHGGLYARHGLVQAVATGVLMFTHGGLGTKPTPQAEVRLAVAQPAIPLADLDQALDDCRGKLYYYYEEEGGCIFKTEPNPNKVLADERANVHTDEARHQVEKVVAEVIGSSTTLQVILYGVHGSPVREPGDVPDEGELLMVVLPPRLTAVHGKAAGQTATVLDDITQNYGKKLRMNRNMMLYLVADSEAISRAIERAIDWLAARNVLGDADLMARFSETQRDTINDRATAAANDTKDYVRRAYNTILLSTGPGTREAVELSYVPPSKTVLEQAEEELLAKGKIHREFNPALFESRWASLWPATATVISTQALWEKFARQGDSPILTGMAVLRETIHQGVERDLFGYGVLRDGDQDKLKAASYERILLGPFDARDLSAVEIGPRTVLLRVDQVYVLFPPITKEEVAMVLQGPRQSVEAAFWAARGALTVQGRVDKRSFFAAIGQGVEAGLFGYAEAADAPVVRQAPLDPNDVHFPGLLVSEMGPLPASDDEIASLVPATGRLTVRELYQKAVAAYGADRVSENGVLRAVERGIFAGRFGYAATATATIRTGAQEVSLDGYVGQPEPLPPDTRVIRFHGSVSSIDLASVVKTAMNLGRLGESRISLDLRLEFKGEVSEHAVAMALNELRGRVKGLNVEDIKGEVSAD